MEEFYLLKSPDWDELKRIMTDVIRSNIPKQNSRYLKSVDVRKMLGGISAAKLQSLRVRGHLPATNADGLWLYDVEDIKQFIERNKTNGEA